MLLTQDRQATSTLLRGNQHTSHHSLPNGKSSKPVAKIYLIGWGVSLLVCSVTVAVNIEHYGEQWQCFMRSQPFWGAVVAPVAICSALLLGKPKTDYIYDTMIDYAYVYRVWSDRMVPISQLSRPRHRAA